MWSLGGLPDGGSAGECVSSQHVANAVEDERFRLDGQLATADVRVLILMRDNEGYERNIDV